MDILTRDLLRSWGLTEYIAAFNSKFQQIPILPGLTRSQSRAPYMGHDQLSPQVRAPYMGHYSRPDGKIDAGTLRLLGNDEINQLIPIPGDRARFKANLENWKTELKSLESESEYTGFHNRTASVPTASVSSDLNLTESSLGSVLMEIGAITDAFIDSSNTNVPLTNMHDSSPSNTNVPQTNLHDQGVSSTPVVAASSCHTQDQCATSTPIPGSTSHYMQQVDQAFTQTIDPLLPGYVLQTLKCTNDGKAILNQGKKSGILDDTQRNLLVKLVISPLFEKDPNIIISNKLLLDWALEIQELFPRESAALYYTPYISTLVRTTARNASGKLLRYVYNRRRQLRGKGIIEGSSRSRSSSASSTVSIAQSPLTNLIDIDLPDIEDKLTVLKNTLEPWNLVEEYWIATASYSLKKNYSELGGTLEDIFKEYPALKQPAGYNLFLKDFEILYKDRSDALYVNIKTLQNKVFELARKKLSNTRDKELKRTVEQYFSAVTENASSDTLNNACLLLLPFLASSVPLKDRKKTTWKPSKTEVRDGIITQIASDAELETTIASRKAKLLRFGKTLQPFVVFVGISITNISHCYVIAGNVYYKFAQLITALDVCYKIIHASGTKYQEESFIIWMIIQKAFYKMQTQFDKEFTTVNSLLVDLGVK